jgi:hypothetical protein
MEAKVSTDREKQALIWDFFKPRHTHTWNMLVISWQEIEKCDNESVRQFDVEYLWENFIIRLWLYRAAVKTLTKISTVKSDASDSIRIFDSCFDTDGKNGLKALRDMIEHFDDYAAGEGHGPGRRERDLDPWRTITKDQYERGVFLLDRHKSYEAAINLRANAKKVSDKFIEWYRKTV